MTSPICRSKKSLQRKITARKNLLESINTRNKDAKCCVKLLQSERSHREFQFPRISCSRDDNLKSWKHSNIRDGGVNTCTKYKPALSPDSCSTSSEDLTGYNSNVFKKNTFRSARTGYSRNISFQEIVMEFNRETSMAISRKSFGLESPFSSAEISEDDRAIGTPYETTLDKCKFKKSNPGLSRYRPVTPGLLKTMNDRKLPSKVKTEQWIKSSKNMHRYHAYKTENISNDTNWIYDDS